MKSIIRHVHHPEPAALYQAHLDHAVITKQPFVENPFWFEDITTGRTFHNLFACLGWPSEVSDRDTGMPGYAAIIGIVRPKSLKKGQYYDPRDARFLLLCEAQSADVPTLLDSCLEMREKYGFGVQPQLLTVAYGDPERFLTTLALKNERLGERNALLLTPPDDFYVPMIFDNYVRSLQSVLLDGRKRLFADPGCDILANHLAEFRRDNPAVLAAGGLIHSLLNRCMWMGQVDGETCFNVED